MILTSRPTQAVHCNDRIYCCEHHIVDPKDPKSEKSHLLNQLVLLFYGFSETFAIIFGDLYQ